MNFRENLKNMKIKNKLNLYGSCMVVVMLFMGIITFSMTRNIHQSIKEITEVWSPSLSYVQQMDTLTSDYRMKQYGHLVATTEREMGSYDTELASIDANLTEVRNKFSSMIETDEERRLYGIIEDKWAEYEEQSEEILRLSRAGKTKEGGELMIGSIYNTFNEFADAFEKLVVFENNALNRAKQNVDTIYNRIIVVIVVTVVLAILIAFGMAKAIIGMITEPVSQIEEAAQSMCAGDMSAGKLISYTAQDELGVVAESMRTAMKNLENYIAEISGNLREIAKGDLTKDSKEITDFLGDFASIKESFVYILKRFNATLSDIQNTAEQVRESSNQITDSSQALSNGASEQAAAIEEVTSALSEAVKLSEENAKDTQESYDSIRTSVNNAEAGKMKMKELTEEMQRIMEISQKIEKINTTIEDIASQTNLLSLNASVEAARAGAAGRGFAVVAEQIGRLASDSARSAVDTRALVGEALKEIKIGNSITADTSVAFESMIHDMENFANVAHKMNENVKIESNALSQVEQQVEMISGEIQNTAATSEENAAISENLAKEAAHLDEMVKRFTLY